MDLLLIFILVAAVRNVNKVLERDKVPDDFDTFSGTIPLKSYFPLVFHIIISITILLVLFSVKLISMNNLNLLVADVSFQFFSTLLLLMIGLISPFTRLTNQTRSRLEFSLRQNDNNNFLDWLIRNNNYQKLKIAGCVSVIALFVFRGWLNIPNIGDTLLSGVTISLIFFYLLNNVIQLIRNPVQFRRTNMMRLEVLLSSIIRSVIILAAAFVLIYIPSTVFELKFLKNISLKAVALLGYNLIMIHNEYKVLKQVK